MTLRAHRGFWVGLTGPMGAGKSFVARVWGDLGAAVVSGDEMGRLAPELNPGLRDALVERFGGGIIRPDGTLDRAKLAAVAFADERSAADLTHLTFPTLYQLATERLETAAETRPLIVYDAALIFEWGVEHDFDTLVVVTAPWDALVQRGAERLGVGLKEAGERLRSQMPPDEKAARADIVINNDGDLEQLRAAAVNVWRELLVLAGEPE